MDSALELMGMAFAAADTVLDPSDGPFSVFAWVKGGAPGQAIISQQAGYDWLMLDPTTGALMTDLRSGGRQSKALRSDAVVTDGTWHPVGFTWDGTNRRLYVDDILVAEDTDVALAACYGGLNIGCRKTAALDSCLYADTCASVSAESDSVLTGQGGPDRDRSNTLPDSYSRRCLGRRCGRRALSN